VEELTCESFLRIFRNDPFSRTWFGLQNGCQRSLRPDGSQLIIAGVLDTLGNKCPTVKAGIDQRLTVEAFVVAVSAGIPSARGSLTEQLQDGFRSAAVLRGGGSLARALECGTDAAQIYANAVDWVEFTSSGPTAQQFVDDCVSHYKGAASPVQCKCFGNVARGYRPSVFESRYTPSLYPEIIKTTPYAAALILSTCQLPGY
jgi:hypothetical protein